MRVEFCMDRPNCPPNVALALKRIPCKGELVVLDCGTFRVYDTAVYITEHAGKITEKYSVILT